MTHVRMVGTGRAARSFTRALTSAGWTFEQPLGRGDDVRGAALGVDVVMIATPDAVVADVAVAIEPVDSCTVLHVSGSLGLSPLATHSRRAVVHPLVALPDGERGAARLRGAWYGLSAERDPAADQLVAALRGRAVEIEESGWVSYHAAAVIAANHLVALLGQAERVAASVGVPLEAYLDLARGSLDDVASIGPAAALTGPVRRGDLATVARHLAALHPDERAAYRAMADAAARLLAPSDGPLDGQAGADT